MDRLKIVTCIFAQNKSFSFGLVSLYGVSTFFTSSGSPDLRSALAVQYWPTWHRTRPRGPLAVGACLVAAPWVNREGDVRVAPCSYRPGSLEKGLCAKLQSDIWNLSEYCHLFKAFLFQNGTQANTFLFWRVGKDQNLRQGFRHHNKEFTRLPPM